MPVPKKRGTRSARGQRRSHDALAAPKLTKCSKCGTLGRPHMVCANCGSYRGQTVKAAAK